jgi:hypothetical protein
MKAFGHAPQLYGADRGFFSAWSKGACTLAVGESISCVVANLRTARVLGLTLPPALLAQAAEIVFDPPGQR